MADKIPWDESRLAAVEQSAPRCPDACSVDAELLVAEVRRLQQLLSRAYPWLHNPYHGTGDIANMAEGDAVIEAVQTVIQHVPDEPDPLLSLPCASCDGAGCPNCRDQEPRAALAYEYPG